tara:strand:+ start:1494 stop:1868 length:375 start_codon:yes stop_codon:yes gene_type:complete
MKNGILKLVFFYIVLSLSLNTYADPIEGNLVEMQILDKITARVKTVNINVNESIIFETLNIEIYTCFKNPPEKIPENFVLLKIYDQSNSDQKKMIYQGWMISSSPAITPLEHPIYDLWLINCKI